MLILPERGSVRTKILAPVRQSEWRQPSQRTGLYQVENQTRFRITARLSDGLPVWLGWFDDRDEADAFYYAVVRNALFGEPVPRSLWECPSETWDRWTGKRGKGWWEGFGRQGWQPLGPGITYYFDTTRFLTSTNTATQTDTVPSDWTNTNTIEVVAQGTNGAANTLVSGTGQGGGGGGGGAYAKISNLVLTAGASVTYSCQAGNSNSADCWYNGASLAASSVGAKAATRASGATAGKGGEQTGNTGSVGTTIYAGGNGGNGSTSNPGGGGGGGASAAPGGAGKNGGASTSYGGGGGGGIYGASATAGSATAGVNGGDGGSGYLGTGGGSGGTGSTTASAAGFPNAGTNGGGGGGGGGNSSTGQSTPGPTASQVAPWDAVGTHVLNAGTGGGGASGSQVASNGGTCSRNGGGGGGAGAGTTTQSGGGGSQGIIVITYTPVPSKSGWFNMPMLGI